MDKEREKIGPAREISELSARFVPGVEVPILPPTDGFLLGAVEENAVDGVAELRVFRLNDDSVGWGPARDNRDVYGGYPGACLNRGGYSVRSRAFSSSGRAADF